MKNNLRCNINTVLHEIQVALETNELIFNEWWLTILDLRVILKNPDILYYFTKNSYPIVCWFNTIAVEGQRIHKISKMCTWHQILHSIVHGLSTVINKPGHNENFCWKHDNGGVSASYGSIIAQTDITVWGIPKTTVSHGTACDVAAQMEVMTRKGFHPSSNWHRCFKSNCRWLIQRVLTEVQMLSTKSSERPAFRSRRRWWWWRCCDSWDTGDWLVGPSTAERKWNERCLPRPSVDPVGQVELNREVVVAAPQGEPAPVEEGMHPAGWELAAAESGILAVLDILVVLGNPVLLGILEFYPAKLYNGKF